MGRCAAHRVSGRSVSTAQEQLFLPVHWKNAFAFFSQGWMCARPGLRKYREDVLERTPGVIPLFEEDALSQVLDPVATDQEFATILEVELPAEARSGLVSIGPQGMWGHPGVIPVTMVTKIHVASDEQADEFRARAYRGVDGRRSAGPRHTSDVGPAPWSVNQTSGRQPLVTRRPVDLEALESISRWFGATSALLSQLQILRRAGRARRRLGERDAAAGPTHG